MRYSYFLTLLFLISLLNPQGFQLNENKQLLNKYLKGTAKYCEKLRREAFHFICQENIVVKFEEILMDSIQPERRKVKRKRYSRKYFFDYQIINKDGKALEQRVKKAGSDESTEIDPSKLVLSFLMEKAVFGPNSIFEREKQLEYIFKFKGKANRNRYVVIEAYPKELERSFFSSAQIWIDANTNAIRRIILSASTGSGFENVMKIASQFKSKLILKCEMRYNKEYKELFFPTKIVVSERYKGGSFIYRNMGPEGWERSRTIFKYEDYKFFSVGVEIKIK